MERRSRLTPEERIALMTPKRAASALGVEVQDVRWLVEQGCLRAVLEWETLSLWVSPDLPELEW